MAKTPTESGFEPQAGDPMCFPLAGLRVRRSVHDDPRVPGDESAADHLVQIRQQRLDGCFRLHDLDDDRKIERETQHFSLWTTLLAPNPETPRNTVAPASPFLRKSSSSASYSGRPRYVSLSRVSAILDIPCEADRV